MSGGHWNYLSHRLRERAEYAGNVWKLLAAIEHELDWGICCDTCLDCASIRTINALKAYFDTEATDEGIAIRLLRSSEQDCERCKLQSGENSQKKNTSTATIEFTHDGKVYRGVAYQIGDANI